MKTEILSKEQKDLLPFLKNFKEEYYLAGGTGIALYLGHRKSIDFDLFTPNRINTTNIIKVIESNYKSNYEKIYESPEQLHYIINNIRISFINYPFNINQNNNLDNVIKIPELIVLAAMKAYTLGRRFKWKDYVDFYFILKNGTKLRDIINKSEYIYKESFSEKLFLQQLCYFEDIDYSEEVEYIDSKPDRDEIFKYLKQVSNSYKL